MAEKFKIQNITLTSSKIWMYITYRIRQNIPTFKKYFSYNIQTELS